MFLLLLLLLGAQILEDRTPLLLGVESSEKILLLETQILEDRVPLLVEGSRELLLLLLLLGVQILEDGVPDATIGDGSVVLGAHIVKYGGRLWLEIDRSRAMMLRGHCQKDGVPLRQQLLVVLQLVMAQILVDGVSLLLDVQGRRRMLLLLLCVGAQILVEHRISMLLLLLLDVEGVQEML